MTEKQPSAEALYWANGLLIALGLTDKHGKPKANYIYDTAIRGDVFAARSRCAAIEECADVCRALGQYSGRNVQPAIEQIAAAIAALATHLPEPPSCP